MKRRNDQERNHHHDHDHDDLVQPQHLSLDNSLQQQQQRRRRRRQKDTTTSTGIDMNTTHSKTNRHSFHHHNHQQQQIQHQYRNHHSKQQRKSLHSSIQVPPHHSSPSGTSTSSSITRNRNSHGNKVDLAASRSDQHKRRVHQTKQNKQNNQLNKPSVKKKHERMEETRKRRAQIDKERIKHLQHNSGELRRLRIKNRAQQEKNKQVKLLKSTMIIILGSRIKSALHLIDRFRQYQRQLELEDQAARVITRQMKMFKFRMYRKRVRGAIRVLATVFLVKVRLWKDTRRRVASDRITAFLCALERDNRDSGGCLALIVKGKKWRVYRLKIIILQRLWRERLKIISSQVLFVDQQWQQEQKKQMELRVEQIYLDREAKVKAENEHIENMNRTRKLLKMQPLPKKIIHSRDEIRNKMLQGEDFLSTGYIVPTEIRHGIIKDMLKYLRCIHLYQLELYEKAYQVYEKHYKDRQRRRALLLGFSGNQIANAWLRGTRSSSSSSRIKVTNVIANSDIFSPPIRPRFHIVLGSNALSTLLKLGQTYVDELRKLWNPRSMDIISLPYNGKEAAIVHSKEHKSIVLTDKRNQSFL